LDAAWEAATVRTESDWTAEIRIPIKSLMFKPGSPPGAFNVQRRVQARQETDRWASASKDIKVTQTSRAGLLTGLPPFDLGIGAEYSPGADRWGRADSATVALSKPGPREPRRDAARRREYARVADGEYRLRGNRGRYAARESHAVPTLLPEKRTFFLEGADIFDFGLGLDQGVIPFFSRRIGLIEGEQVPINAGGKINGRLGGLNVGALAVNTRDVDTLSAPARWASFASDRTCCRSRPSE
jgi:hypothetical protein